jgi:hypothetical protein
MVSGNAVYKHKVWNYSSDTVHCYNYLFGIPYACSVYAVDKRTTSKHHDLIMLSPLARWGLMSTLAHWLFGEGNLKQLNLLRGTHNFLQVKTKDHLLTSVGVPGQYACATMPTTLYNTFENLAATTKAGLTRAGLESLFPSPETPEEKLTNYTSATILLDYFNNNQLTYTASELANAVVRRLTAAVLSRPPIERVSIVDFNPPTYHRYQYGQYDMDAKPLLTPFMSPLINGAYAPDKTLGNEQRCVKARVTDIASDKHMTPFLITCMNEFITMLIPEPHHLEPVDHDEVSRRQPTPSQQQLLEQADETLYFNPILKTFVKAEAYLKPTDPRMISTITPKLKVEYARYCYAMSDWIKKLPCYAFSKSPHEVDEAVVRTCSLNKPVAPTDFSRYDGTISPAARQFESAVLRRSFSPPHHAMIDEIHKLHFNNVARCTLGTTYSQGYARASGGADTSLFNSLFNMFANYVGHRMTPGEISKFRTPDEAWAWTNYGLYGGDDGLAPNVDVSCYTRACTALGLNVKASLIKVGEPGVNFLGRIYGPSVWTGDLSNCADLPRQLGKLHVTHPRPGVDHKQILVDKLIGFYHTDRNTPVLGQFATKVFEINQSVLKPNYAETSYYASNAHAQDQLVFNNPPRDWYMEYARESLKHFNFDKFNEWINTRLTLEECMQAPTFAEIPSVEIPTNVDLVIGHDIVSTAPKPVAKVAQSKKPARRKHKTPAAKAGVKPVPPAGRSGRRVLGVKSNSTL